MHHEIGDRWHTGGPVSAAVAAAVGELQTRRSCPACGKRCYPRRKAAKLAARRLYPGKHMRAYQCGEFWHLTSRLARQKEAARSAARLRAGQGSPSPAGGRVAAAW